MRIQGNTLRGTLNNETISLFSTLTTGLLKIGEGITTGTMEIAKSLTTGTLNIGTFGATTSTINIGNLGDINIGTTLVSNIINIGGSFVTTGSVRLCNTIYFRTNSITASVATNTISLFNNLTSGGTLNIGGSGKVKIGNYNISGYPSFYEHNGGNGNYNVPADVNFQHFVYVTGSPACSVYLPANKAGQQIYIRNAMNATYNNVISPTSNITLPAGGISNIYPIQTNKATMLYNDGSRWIVFDGYY